MKVEIWKYIFSEYILCRLLLDILLILWRLQEGIAILDIRLSPIAPRNFKTCITLPYSFEVNMRICRFGIIVCKCVENSGVEN